MAECSSSTKWACSLCTYLNYQTSLKCTVCLTVRCLDMPLIIEEAASISGFSNSPIIDDDANFANDSESLINSSERWSCSSCTYLNCLRTKKCVQCYTNRPLRYGSDSSLNNSCIKRNSPIQNSSVISKALNKWNCINCTFDNWPNAERCTMCYAERLNLDDSSEIICSQKLDEEEIENLTNNFASSNVSSIPQDFSKTEHYTSALDIYLRRFTANDQLECLFFKSVLNIGNRNLEAVNSVVDYLINEGNIHRRFTSLEARMLNSKGFMRIPIEAGDSLITISKKYDCPDLVKLIKRVTSMDDKLPCTLNCATRNSIYGKVAQSMAIRNGAFNVQFITHPSNFSIFKFPISVNDYNMEIMNAMLKPAPSIPPTYCFVDCYDTIRTKQNVIVNRLSNFLLKNRGAAYSLCDAIFQAMFGVCDRYNILRTALKYTMMKSDHLFKVRWQEQYVCMARDCGLKLCVDDLDNDWEDALNVITNEADCLEPIHIWALSHIVCRPIVVVPMTNPIDLEDLETLTNFMTEKNKSRIQRNHIFEGIYLPILWASPPVTRSPLILTFRNGLFYAVIVSDGLYKRNQDIQNFLKIHFSKRDDNLFRFLTRSELENSKLINQFISLGICDSNSISIRRDPHSFLFETLLFYSNWVSAIHCCGIENSGELKLSKLEQKINAPFDFSNLCFCDKFSIFAVKALDCLKRDKIKSSTIAETSRNELMVSDEEEEEEDDDDDDDVDYEEEEEDNESLTDLPA